MAIQGTLMCQSMSRLALTRHSPLMIDDRERLNEILTAIDRIVRKTGREHSEFENNEMLQDWVLHHLQIIGVAAGCLSEDLRKRHPDRVWADASGMRNTPGQHYFEIDA
jgi:uncharacterized protein with HEPN domain